MWVIDDCRYDHLFRLYQAECAFQVIKDQKLPEKYVEIARRHLHRKWDAAKKAGITTEEFEKEVNGLYLTAVILEINKSYRNSCRCHRGFENDPARVCQFSTSTHDCSPFCEHRVKDE